MASAAGRPAAAAGSREVLAFDLYGTLVDPIAISSELSRLLGDRDGLEVARLWRLKQLEYSFRLTAMGWYEDFRWVTSRALDFALASFEARLPADRLGGWPACMTTCGRSRTPCPRCGHWPAWGMSSRCSPTAPLP